MRKEITKQIRIIVTSFITRSILHEYHRCSGSEPYQCLKMFPFPDVLFSQSFVRNGEFQDVQAASASEVEFEQVNYTYLEVILCFICFH